MSIAQNIRFTISVFAVSTALLAMGFLFASAQEETTAADVAADDAQATELAEQDENVTHEDLGVGDPAVLPGNPLYVFKNAFRGVQTVFTFDPADKAELKLKFASERIIEAKKLEEGGASDERIQVAIENYEKETLRVKTRIENLKDSGKSKEEIELIVKHAADRQIKHHKALGRVMQNRDNIAPEIEAAKAMAMKHFSESMAHVVEPEVLAAKFEEALGEQKGSAFRHFKHVEVLEEVKDFVPEQARGAIQNAIEHSSKFFEEEFKNTEEDQRKIFNKYIEKIGGNEVRHLEAFDSLGAFADVEKEMFQEMEKAREKTRKRVEKRMASIEDETRKQVFVSHLEEGKLEDARIVKELETNLDPQTITAVLDIKHKMEQKMRERFENAESTGDLENFFDETEDFHDVQMMQTLAEMEGIIPEDKKEFWQEMKQKAMTEMQGEIEEARAFGRVEDKMRMMAGFDPEHMAVLDGFEQEFGPQFTFFEDIRREQAGRIQERFEHFGEFTGERPDETEFLKKAEEFRLRIEGDPSAQAQIRQFAPEIDEQFTEFDTQRARADVSRENLDEAVKKAEELVRKLSQKLVATDDKNPGKNAARELYSNASAHIADITILISQGKTGEAFGKANSAAHLASNGLRKLEQEAFKEERNEYFQERDKFRESFRDLPRGERPDPAQFLKFESKAFPSFEPPPGITFPRPAAEGRAEKARPVSRDEKRGDEEPVFCAQVLTPARHPLTGKCVTFPNSCIPVGWERVKACLEHEEIKPILDDSHFRRDEVEVVPIGLHPFEEEAARKAEEQQRTAPTPVPDKETIEATELLRESLERFIPQPSETTQPLPATEQKTLEEQRILEQQTFKEPTVSEPLPISPTPTFEPEIKTFDSGATGGGEATKSSF